MSSTDVSHPQRTMIITKEKQGREPKRSHKTKDKPYIITMKRTTCNLNKNAPPPPPPTLKLCLTKSDRN